MSRREEIIAEAKKHEYDWGIDVDRFDVPDIFAKGAEWADATIIEKLRELKRGYENDLDAEPWVYERHFQLCAKISLIERLILELEEE